MSQRVTRQYVSVLGPGDGKLRVTRQYAYVLISLTAPSVLDYLTLNQTVDYILVPGTHVVTDSFTLNQTVTGTVVANIQDISDSLTLNQTVAVQGNFIRPFTDSLTLNETVSIARVKLVSVSDTFAFVDAPSPTHTEVVDDDLILADGVGYFQIIGDFYAISDTLSFTESVIAEKPTTRYVYDSFSFNESAVGYNATKHADITHLLWFVENATGVNPTIRRTVVDSVVFTEIVGRSQTYTVADSFSFVESLTKKNAVVLDTLTLNQTVLQGRQRPISPDSLSLIQTVMCVADFTRDAIDSLAIGHTLTYYVIRPCTDKQYSPFVGESTVTGLPTAPTDTLPPFVGLPANTRFQLAYPAAGAFTALVTLPAPEFENKDRISATRINRETRGGRLSVFADPAWPKINTVACNFTGLTTAEVAAFQEFVGTYIGLEINITDWEGREWIGVITGPNEPATHDGKDDWSIGFEFEGVLVDRIPNNSISFNEVVTYEVV